MRQSDTTMFLNIKSGQAFDVKEFGAKTLKERPVALYYDDDHVLVSETNISSPDEMKDDWEVPVTRYLILKYDKLHSSDVITLPTYTQV